MLEIEMKIVVVTDGRSVSHAVSGCADSGQLSYISGDGSGWSDCRAIHAKEVRCIACALLSGMPNRFDLETFPTVEAKVTEKGVNRIVRECNIFPASDDGSLRISLRDIGTGISESMEILSSELKCFFCFIFNEERFPEDIWEIFNTCPDLCQSGCVGLPFMRKMKRVPS